MDTAAMVDLKAKPDCCEEASPQSHLFYIPCNRPATNLVQLRDEGPYRMCEMCTYHNIKNRGGTDLGPYVRLSNGTS